MYFRLSLIVFCFSLNCTKASSFAADKDSGHVKTISIHFHYGSKPARGHKQDEIKGFGGFHGGHVYIQIDEDSLFSFYPSSNWHIIAYKKELGGMYKMEDMKYWKEDSVSEKYTTFVMPLSDSAFVLLENIRKAYLKDTPYDYAFFGIRCASATYDVLSQVGLLKKRSRFIIIYRYFYPKLLRKKLFKLAVKKNWTVIKKEGRESLKWEKD